MDQPVTRGPAGQHHVQPASMMEGASSSSSGAVSGSGQSPVVEGRAPRTPPDHASIQMCMDKNKESLKRKLMLRRSVNELVDQGIYPSLKAPPAFAEKIKRLERAKTGDLLRHKIQHRPQRQLLVQQHILEDTKIDPSLHERQRLLKRSRLLDDLNDKLSHRPGPLELVQENILQPSCELANAIKDGSIQFVPTCDIEDMDHSSSSALLEEDSSSSEGATSPFIDESSHMSDAASFCTSPSSAPADPLPISVVYTNHMPMPLFVSKDQPIPVVYSSSSLIATSTSNPKISIASLTYSNNHSSNHISGGGSGKFRAKKPKPKATPKTRIIKFHEYKGPPSVVKNQVTVPPAALVAPNPTGETPYHILLQQQQLFLQLQLEFQQQQKKQHGSLPVLSPTTLAPDVVGDGTRSGSLVVTSPVGLTPTSPSLTQPSLVDNTGLVKVVSLQQPLTFSSPPITSQAIFSQVSMPLKNGVKPLGASATVLPPPPPPPLPASTNLKPTQTVTPRQAAKPLTAIPTNALSLPKLTGNLEEMKVADLKAELKKRSLPVSGSKPQLIERLKPFSETTAFMSSASSKPNPKPALNISVPPSPNGQKSAPVKLEHHSETTSSVPMSSTSPITTTAPLLPSSPQSLWTHSSSVSVPISSPQGARTVVSVKPMMKEEPSPDTVQPISPSSFISPVKPSSQLSPKFEVTPFTSPVSKLTLPFCQGLLTSGNYMQDELLLNNSHNHHHFKTLSNPAHTFLSLVSDTSSNNSILPSEMLPMEVDSVSVDLNQGISSTVFKKSGQPRSLSTTDLEILIQQPGANPGYSTINLGQGTLGGNVINTSHSSGVNLSPVNVINLNSDHSDGLRTVASSPNLHSSMVKTITLNSSLDCAPMKTIPAGQNTDSNHFKIINMNPMDNAVSLLQMVKVPISTTHQYQIQRTNPLAQTVTSPTHVLDLQQLQQVQALQRQVMQQVPAPAQVLQQQPPLPTTLASTDQIAASQARQIEELQRQLQESHLRLKLQQILNALNALSGKLPENQQQVVIPQLGQVLAAQLQLQQQQQQKSNLASQQQQQLSLPLNSVLAQQSQLAPVTSMVQQQSQPAVAVTSMVQEQSQPQTVSMNSLLQQQSQPASLLLNGHTGQHSPMILSGSPAVLPSIPKSPVSAECQPLVFSMSPPPPAMGPGQTNTTSSLSPLPLASFISNQPKNEGQSCIPPPPLPPPPPPQLNVPKKEPPRYDEAIKTKQKQQQQQQQQQKNQTAGVKNKTKGQNPDINGLSKSLDICRIVPEMKSQTVDDVLEILIRNGDLPPSAATEVLPTSTLADMINVPQTGSDTLSTTTTSSNLTVTSPVSPVVAQSQSSHSLRSPSSKASTSRSSPYSHPTHTQPSSSSSNSRDNTLTSVLTNGYSDSFSLSADTPPPPTLDNLIDSGELHPWGDMMTSDLSNMDWAVEFGQPDPVDSSLCLDSKIYEKSHSFPDHKSFFGSSALVDFTNNSATNNDIKNNQNNINNNFLNQDMGFNSSYHMSENDIHDCGLGFDADTGEGLDTSSQMDMTDWLDTLMPGSSSFNYQPPQQKPARSPVTSDPLLTPQTRLNMFDIFDTDDQDMGPSPMSWEKFTEQGINSL